MDRSTRASRALGVAALVATIALWASYALSTRALGGMQLEVVDAAILRFGVPALALAPWARGIWRRVRAERPATTLLLLAAGLPHLLLFAWGAERASAGLTALVVPGTVPVFVAILLAVAARARRRALPRSRWRVRTAMPLALIVAGVVAALVLAQVRASVLGIGILLAAGLLWAVYTLAVRDSGLRPTDVVAVIATPSLAAALLLAGTGAMPSRLLAGTAGLGDVLTIALLQGVGTGLLSTLCYVCAVQRLGASVSATAGALSPVVTAIVAVPLLGEGVGVSLAVPLVLIVAGVVVAALPRPTGSMRILPHADGRARAALPGRRRARGWGRPGRSAHAPLAPAQHDGVGAARARDRPRALPAGREDERRRDRRMVRR